MCVDIPMQVMEAHEFHAICLDGDKQVRVDTTLVGTTYPGNWLLVFLAAAREILDIGTAVQMRDAVNAVNRVMRGNTHIEHLFDDLVDREAPLPEHLKHLIGG